MPESATITTHTRRLNYPRQIIRRTPKLDCASHPYGENGNKISPFSRVKVNDEFCSKKRFIRPSLGALSELVNSDQNPAILGLAPLAATPHRGRGTGCAWLTGRRGSQSGAGKCTNLCTAGGQKNFRSCRTACRSPQSCSVCAERWPSRCLGLCLVSRLLLPQANPVQTQESLCCGYRGGLVFQAHRLLYHST